jgi:hypothetical protein
MPWGSLTEVERVAWWEARARAKAKAKAKAPSARDLAEVYWAMRAWMQQVLGQAQVHAWLRVCEAYQVGLEGRALLERVTGGSERGFSQQFRYWPLGEERNGKGSGRLSSSRIGLQNEN